jgi:hypothetical protein
MYNISGSPYAAKEKDYMVYAKNDADAAAAAALSKTMDQVCVLGWQCVGGEAGVCELHRPGCGLACPWVYWVT